jgi:hypothetical protein
MSGSNACCISQGFDRFRRPVSKRNFCESLAANAGFG